MSSDFIKMVSDLSERRFLRTVQNLIADKVPCGIFFAPAVPNNAREIVDSFKKSGLNMNCICVLSQEHKQFFQPAEDETLITLEEFPSLDIKPKHIFAIDGLFPQMFWDYFQKFGTEISQAPVVDTMEKNYNLFMKHLPELHDVHEMLADDESKKVFRASITGKLTASTKDFRFAPEPQYFLNGFLPEAGDIVIDGGAYDGETAVDFVRQGAKVYAFEMDADNYRNCIAPAEKFGFTIENLGLSNMESESLYMPAGVGSRKIANNTGGYCRAFH